MKLRVIRTVAASPDAVYAWWTDFREDDHAGVGSPARSARTIVRRTGNEVWLRDVATRPVAITIEEHVTLDPPHGYRVEARYPLADVKYGYRFDPVGDSTRIVLEVQVGPRSLGRILVALTAWWWRRYTERDLDFHLREMMSDLSR